MSTTMPSWPLGDSMEQLNSNVLISATEAEIHQWSRTNTIFSILFIITVILALIYRHRLFILYVLRFLKLKVLIYRFLLKRQTISDVFEERLPELRNKPALVFEYESFTFGDVERDSNRLARWLLSLKLPPMSCVGLLMESRPEFIIVWLAAAKVDLKIALINATMRGNSLSHAIHEAEAKILIYGAECQNQVLEILGTLPNDMPVFHFPDVRFAHPTQLTSRATSSSSTSDGTNYVLPQHILSNVVRGPANQSSLRSSKAILDLTPLVTGELGIRPQDTESIPKSIRANRAPHDPLFLIFTSGTTGLPKAARVSHTRIFMAGLSFALFHNVTSEDVIYCPLPLYHSAAGLLGVGMSWSVGAPLVIKRKFSASNFFRDCFEYNVTVIQYIGQLCRYLLATPPTPFDTRHSVKKAIGNGLRGDVWDKFQKRFKIPYIGEFYGSTEGNATLINTMNRMGACGYLPHITTLVYPARLIRVEGNDMIPVRGPDGLCQECDYDEPGELLGKITSDPLRQFTGYTRDSESKKKILENVFSKGDKWFRTGDLLRKDSEGYLYFVDRLGDTFRWKGENCACNQVESIIANLDVVEEAVVYGVPIPGYEDKAGMACIILKQGYGITSKSMDVASGKLTDCEPRLDATAASSTEVNTATNTCNARTASIPTASTTATADEFEEESKTASPTHSADSSSLSYASGYSSSSATTHASLTSQPLSSLGELQLPFEKPKSRAGAIRITDAGDGAASPFQSFGDEAQLLALNNAGPNQAASLRKTQMNLPIDTSMRTGLDDMKAISLSELYHELSQNLAKWQIPVFLRITIAGGIDSTATFKPNKTRLIQENFVPSRIPPTDALFLCDERSETYIPLTQAVYDDIVAGRRRL